MPDAENEEQITKNKKTGADDSIKLTSEQKLEMSWNFLDDITQKVIELKEQVNEQIIQCGKTLNGAEVTYVHVVQEGPNFPRSPAKEALKAKEDKKDKKNQR